MSNENTIYECPNDPTKWYGSNQNPEVCPVCGTKGNIEVPQEFQSQAQQAEVETIIANAPVETPDVEPESPVEAPEELSEITE